MDSFKTLLSVKKVMNNKIAFEDGFRTVTQASIVMLEKGVDYILVKSGDEIKGIITETDIVKKVVAKRINPEKMTLEELMSGSVIDIESDESIFEAKKIMEEKSIQHLVVKEAGNIIGMISSKELIKT